MREDAVNVALAAVHQAVVDLQETNLNGAAGLQSVKVRLNAALLAAKEKGASEHELLEAARVRSIEVEDAGAVGAAARRARKLRLLEKELRNKDQLEQERMDKERSEKERAARVAERLAARRVSGKGSDLPEPEDERTARVAQKVAARRAETKAGGGAKPDAVGACLAAVAPSMATAAAVAPTVLASTLGGGAAASQNGAGDALQQRQPRQAAMYGGLTAKGEAASLRGRSRSRGHQRSVADKKDDQQASRGLAGRLGAPSMADVPLYVLMGGSSGLLRGGMAALGPGSRTASDLSTGGGEVCYNFSIGKCMRWTCRFKHVRPGG